MPKGHYEGRQERTEEESHSPATEVDDEEAEFHSASSGVSSLYILVI